MPIKEQEDKKSTLKDKSKKGNDEKLAEECVGRIGCLAIDIDLIEFPVNFVMNDDIRQIEFKNIVDEKLETLDSMPDIQILFKEYDKRYFRGLLSHNKVEILWADRLTACTGNTQIDTRYLNNDCNEGNDRPVQIRMSRKLLKFGQRRQLVETLLHEMIHAYQFVSGQFDEEHGPEFVAIMKKINEITGADVTILHDIDKCGDRQNQEFREKFKMFRESKNNFLKSKGLIQM